MNKLFYFLFIAAVLGLAACGDDPFATTVEIDFPDHDPLPAATLDLRTGDTAVYGRVALSRGILEDAMMTTAIIRAALYKDGDLIIEEEFTPTSTDGDNFAYPLPNPIGPEEATYRIEVDYSGFDQVTAEQTMPSVPSIRNLEYEREGAIDLEGFRVDELEFDLIDDPATEDYYGFRVLAVFRDTFLNDCGERPPSGEFRCDTFANVFQNELFLQSPDPTLRFGEGFGLVVSDAAFNSSTFRVRMTADNFYTGGELSLEVFHLTEDAYRYAISLDAYFQADGNPFAEPVSIHNNVEGGYGYFVLSNRIAVEIE